MSTEILLIGAGGHAKVVIEALQISEPDTMVVLVDENMAKAGQKILGKWPIVFLDDWSKLPTQYHVAIGNNHIREKCSLDARKNGKELLTIMHPDAFVSPSTAISAGCFIAAKAVVAAESKLGEGCIINHGAIVDHDCCIGSYSHIGPNVTIGGGVFVGEGCLIGAGATILPLVKIGDHSIIGSGSVITKDVPSNQTIVGVPGRQVK